MQNSILCLEETGRLVEGFVISAVQERECSVERLEIRRYSTDNCYI